MEFNLKNYKLVNVDAPYPIGYIDNFIGNSECEKLFKEICAFDSYDDLVMNGRMRVNKGSQKFKEYLENSPNLLSLYEKLNNKVLFLEMKNKLDLIVNKQLWKAELKNFNFSQINYGEQKFSLLKYLRKSWLISKFFKKTVNLDIDFSRSKKGYFRQAHRDRDTRIISFLLYLNSIDKNLGGEFEVYKVNKATTNLKDLKRFPDLHDVTLVEKFSPKAGQLFIFTSTPDSYHGVSKFISDSKDRVFIYGSYSLDRKVDWKFSSERT